MKNPLAKLKDLGKITSIFRGLLPLLKKHYFVFLLGVLILFVIWGVYIFWQFGIRAVNEPPEVGEQSFRLQENVFQKVSENLRTRKEALSEILEKEYPDIFR